MKKTLLLICFLAYMLNVRAQTLFGLTNKGGNDNGGALIKFIPATNSLTVSNFFEVYAANPYATNFIQASDGKLYGMTAKGGNGSPFYGSTSGPANGFGNGTCGIIFSFDPSNSTYKMLKAFDYTNGSEPLGSLVQASNGKLYGITSAGGSSGYGVIFSFDPSTSTYTKLKDFNGSNGRYPFGSLVQSGNGKLYGMTSAGGSGNGSYGYGVFFSFDPLTSTYTKLRDFDFTNGANPTGSLVLASNGKLYGMTERGGDNDGGAIFSFDPSTSTYTKLKDFPYDIDGRWPRGSLIQAINGKLYGMTPAGGSYAGGVIFSFDPFTSTYTKLKDFDGIDGTLYGSLMQASNGKLYGMTQNGENYSGGVIFSFDPSTSTYTKLKNLDSGTWNSLSPHGDGSLMQAGNGKLYGMTCFGGNTSKSNLTSDRHGNGIIFSFDPSSSVYTKLMNLDSNGTGTWPSGTVMQASNGKFYGMTQRGGSFGWGVIFSFDPSNSTYTKLKDFDGISGGEPSGNNLIQANNGKLYGITNAGGSHDYGVIFSFDPSTSIYTKLIDFDGTNGFGTYGSLIQASNEKLYGMWGSSIFSFDLSSLTLTNFGLYDIQVYDAKGSLIQASDGKLYGMTSQGGSNNYGVLFSFDLLTSTATKLKDFNIADGIYPYGNLIQASDGKLYGMANTYGGCNCYNGGVIFSYDLSSSTYTRLKDLDYTSGFSPYGSLMQASDGKLYGMTSQGGDSNFGVIFSLDISSLAYTKLKDFDGANGAYPSFGSAFIEVNSGVLPVVWGDFTAEKNNNTALLKWSTLQEQNTSKFIIEKSADGAHFTVIGVLNAAGNSNVTSNYQFNDAAPLQGVNFYRLKQVDKDGKFTYSNIVHLKIPITSAYQLSVFPNPFANSTTISFTLLLPIAIGTQKVSIQIFDMAGRLVKILAYTEMQAGYHQIIWNLKDEKGNAVNTGNYFLKMDTGSYSTIKKLLVIK